jgi:CHAD domain-containing protein
MMSYSLDPSVTPTAALRRVGLAQLDMAQAGLASSSDRHGGVHSTRKSLKRLRSLLLIARPGLPEPVFAHLMEQLTAIAKGLAPARDAQALIDAIDKLEKDDQSGEGTSTPIQSLRGWLQKRRQIAEQNLEKTAASDALRGLRALRPTFASLSVYPDDFTPLTKGLKRCYRDTRAAFRLAFESGSAEDLHEWRKGVQHHWRHMQLLTPCRPEELAARVESARALSQLLGDDHDIALLVRLISTPTMMFGSPEETTAFLKRCRKRHKALRREARTHGETLFTEGARAFTGRIDDSWAKAAEKAAEKAALMPSSDNIVAFGELRTSRAS